MHVNMSERMNSCVVEGLESLNSLPYSLTSHTSVLSSAKWFSLKRNGDPMHQAFSTWSSTFQGICHFPGSSFSPSMGRVNPPLSSCSLTPDFPADPLPKPRGRLAAVYLGPGPRREMHLHSCDPRTEHLLSRWPEPGAAAADGEGKNLPGAPGRL